MNVLWTQTNHPIEKRYLTFLYSCMNQRRIARLPFHEEANSYLPSSDGPFEHESRAWMLDVFESYYSPEIARSMACQSGPLISYRTMAPCRRNILIDHGGRFSPYPLHSHSIKPRGKVNQICEGAYPFGDACSRPARHGDGRTRPGRFTKFAISGSFLLHFILLFWFFCLSPNVVLLFILYFYQSIWRNRLGVKN